jgi:imidazolonepropionase-like amidohydrolase
MQIWDLGVSSMRSYLTNFSLIDCTGAPLQENMTLVMEGDRIIEIISGSLSPHAHRESQRVFDLKGGFVIPGLWEVHTHLGDLIPDPHNYLETESINDYAIRAGRNAIEALKAGITGIRTVGDAAFVDVAWKKAFETGILVGPRLFVSTRAISVTGGHGHGTLGALEADGPDEMREAVQDNLDHGADLIKLMVTGGIMNEGESLDESQLSLEEILAATELAHKHGKHVAVHAWGAGGVQTALEGGVDSIEHGLLDEKTVAMILEKDAFYVPTICCTQDEEFYAQESLPDYQKKKALAAAQSHREGLLRAYQAGVKIACGSDSTPTAEFTRRELEHLVKAGLSEMDALIAATRTSADLCGVRDILGTIEAGKLADLVVLVNNPLQDISNVRGVQMIFKGGNVVDPSTPEGQADFFDLYC